MLFKILKKDLQRKKVMNIILFIFMVVASALIASSVNTLYATTTALEQFKKESNIADNMVLAISDKENDQKMEEWIRTNKLIKNYYLENTIFITADNLKIPSQYGEFKDDTTLVLSKVPTNYNLVFNQDNIGFEVSQGEVAIPMLISEKYGIQIGDKITIQIEDTEKELTVKHIIKDVTFGSGFMGFKRIMISDQDYEELSSLKNNVIIKIWSLEKQDDVTYVDVEKEFNTTDIVTVATFNSDLISYSYITDLILAGIMMIVSIFLIFISFLILRFTIVFTIEEDYKQIGILKAIGLKNKGIKRIYMLKYFAIAFIGGGIGFLLSIPFARYLLQSIANHIIIKSTLTNYILSILSILCIIFITIGFCYLSTRRINKLSAIDAIRQGSTGERFSAGRKLKLHKLPYIKASYYLAVSDLISGFRRFIILMITFVLGTALIIIPTNVINTLNSNKILTLFGRSEFDFTIGSSGYITEYLKGSTVKLLTGIDDLEQQMKHKGVEADIYPDVYYVSKVYTDKKEESKSILSQQALNYSSNNFTYSKGTAPRLANEVAITTVLAEYFGLDIGDTIHCSLKDQTSQYIITGLYQSMNNLGNTMRFSETHPIAMKDATGLALYGTIQGKDMDKEKAIAILKDNFRELDISSNGEYTESLMGSITGQLGAIQTMILIVVMGINFLITSLLVRMLLSKEIPEVAVLKSIGFKEKDIRRWQTGRIAILLVTSVIIGTIFANVTDSFFTSGIFRSIGVTQIELMIKPLQVYLFYPALIVVVTMAAVLTGLSQIRKTAVWEINNQE